MKPPTADHGETSGPRLFHYLQWAPLGKSGLLRYLAGAFLVLFISLFFGQVFSAFGGSLISSQSPAATIVKTTFFGFIVSFLLIPWIAPLLHRRPWWSIAMPDRRMDARRFSVGFFSVIVVQGVLGLVGYFINPDHYHFAGTDWPAWILMFFVAFIIFFVQAGTEEMVYRGYLAQFAARYTRNPLVILLVPSVIFASPHVGNIEGMSGLGALMPYILMGLLYGWLAWRSGSLWMAIGAHVASNWFITLFVGSSAEKIEKVSLFMTSGSPVTAGALTLNTGLFVVSVILLAEVIMRRFRLRVPLGPAEGGRLETDRTA